MARIRYIKPTIGTDEDLASLSIPARYLFAILPTLCDREGRMEDSARVIKLSTFPWDDIDVESLLVDLSRHCIQRYSAGGKRYLAVLGFSKHQRPHTDESPSKIPAPPAIKQKRRVINNTKDESPGISRQAVKFNGKPDESKRSHAIKGDWDGKGGLGKGTCLAATPPEAVKKPKTGVQKVIRAFKEAKGIDADDAAWDKLNFKRFARAATDVLKVFGDDANAAILYVLTKGQELDDKNMVSWGLEAIARAAATDNRVQDFIRGENNGSENVSLDAVGVPGPRRLGGVTRAGEISGDALEGLRQQAEVHDRKQGQLGGPPEDSFDDGSNVF